MASWFGGSENGCHRVEKSTGFDKVRTDTPLQRLTHPLFRNRLVTVNTV